MAEEGRVKAAGSTPTPATIPLCGKQTRAWTGSGCTRPRYHSGECFSPVEYITTPQSTFVPLMFERIDPRDTSCIIPNCFVCSGAMRERRVVDAG